MFWGLAEKPWPLPASSLKGIKYVSKRSGSSIKHDLCNAEFSDISDLSTAGPDDGAQTSFYITALFIARVYIYTPICKSQKASESGPHFLAKTQYTLM